MKPLFARCLSFSAIGLTTLLWAAAASAQYKVVHPDGSVIYTDRPPITGNARITSIGPIGARAAPTTEIGLPADLRRVVQRYPVTLYTGSNCPPCDTGRRLLQERGVPYSERSISTEDDASALERLVGARTVPSLSIGAQPLRGLSETDWTAYLDVAGYPKESQLPRGWPTPEPAPLVERVAPSIREAAVPARPLPRPAAPVEVPQPTGGIRF